MINWLTTLSVFKSFADISGTTNDSDIETLIAAASDDIESHTRRKLRIRTYGNGGLDAEYGNGNGSARYHTKEYPIVSITSLYEDTEMGFGSTTEISSDDFQYKKDTGKIRLLPNAGLVFSDAKENVKIIYTAGYGTFLVTASVNDRIDFQVGEGGAEKVATLDADVYTAEDLATEIAAQMITAIGNGDTIACAYNERTGLFTIVSDGSYLKILWNTGTNVARSSNRLLGFGPAADDSGGLTYSSDLGVLSIPQDLEMACLMLVLDMYNKWSLFGGTRFGIKSVRVEGERAGTTGYEAEDMPKEVVRRLQRYVRTV